MSDRSRPDRPASPSRSASSSPAGGLTASTGTGLLAGGRGLLVPTVLGSLLVLYFVVPFVAFVAHVGAVDLRSALADPGVQTAIRNSLLTAPVSTAIAAVLGVPLAYVLSNASFRGKRLIELVVLLPLVLPPIVGGAVLLTFVGRYTPVGTVAAAVGLPLTDSLAGVILAQTFVAAPFLVVTARAGFDAVDDRLEEAARTMGYGPLETFRHVSFPLARTAIAAGVVLTFVRAIGEFGATMMVAYNPRTMPTRLWVSYVSYGVDAIVPIALALLAVTVVVVVAIGVLLDGRS